MIICKIPECIDFLIQELKQSHWKELPILDHRLFWWPWSLGSTWFSDTEGIFEVSVNCIVSFPLSLWWLNPLNKAPSLLQYKIKGKIQEFGLRKGALSAYLLLLPEVFTLKFVDTSSGHIKREIPQLRFTKVLHLLIQLCSLQKKET